ncbi:Phosphatidylinositol 4-kinase pik1alpha (PI4-kinase)(PtdIns-4-kinase) [Coemansia sp. RSA 1358]|uniref:1-phosphatidylinositol 4-kinase n=1 Tax=Coemansia umbellata TaxID=1424467 RepID=A0ABQ8PR74_9FUNG|nr:Phosphatidylinositol 4-kinase pik1alpha (PI4-kinase)(PtdIns-4-kinase) [Coemansia umbellata]KAJ2624315.1 Phosphatidylinositol 4-kinase pik1alpha (PI4-kinase)(PtdIns-4-kinase) [Coemansia sp. RSA 1358]
MTQSPTPQSVQHYLCNELRKFPLEEVEFFLPQLVHLLITRPNDSTALESVLLDMCLQSSHVSIILYWYLQTYLADQSTNPRTTSFKHCQRIFNQVQELLFTDIGPELIIDSPEPVQHVYIHAMNNVTSTVPNPKRTASLASRFKRMFRLAPQVRENSQAALVGITSALVSVGTPSLAQTMGWMAISEGQGLKLSESAANDPDITLQYRSLSGRSRSMVRDRRMDHFTLPDKYDSDTEPQLSALRAQTQDSPYMKSDKHGQDEEKEVVAAYLENTRLRRNYGDSPPFSAYAAPQRIENPVQISTGVFSPPQRLNIGSGSPTPAERTSSESCHTVAVMESPSSTSLAHTSIEVFGGSRREGGQDSDTEIGNAIQSSKTGSQSRKSYLSKATKQFQRNAKAFDRRMGRSFDDTQSMLGDRGCSISASNYAAPANKPRSTCEEQYADMQNDLADMSMYMEKERRKLKRRSGYFGAEIKFMTALMDISQRVCAVAKAGRQQFLKAELTLLNHSLDRNTCIPLWCPESGGQHHHRIVRIPTDDTVVLNSAERAPYLLTLEVLEPDGSVGIIDSYQPESPVTRNNEQSPVDVMQLPPENDSESKTVSDGIYLNAASSNPNGSSEARVQNTVDISDGADATSILGEDALGMIDNTTFLSHVPASDENSTPETKDHPESEPTPFLPSAAEDVDEKLMAEVFGNLDDVSDATEQPLSPITNRLHSGSYGKARSAAQMAKRKNRIPKPLNTGARGDINKSSVSFISDSKQQAHYSRDNPGIRQQKANPAPLSPPDPGSRSTLSRVPVSQDDIRARMRTASVLLAQLARQQKALGIKVNNLFIPQISDTTRQGNAKAKVDLLDTAKRRSKLNSATAQALAMEEIREKLIHEMMQLEELRLKQPGLDSVPGSTSAQEPGVKADGGVDDDIDMHQVEFKDDPSAKVLKEDWEAKKARIRRTSPYGRYKNWNLLSVIVKEGADLRQEQLALQLIREMQRIWQHEQTNVFVQYYRIMVTGEGCGLMETITNTVSVHSIKKEFYFRNPEYKGPPYTLYNYFVTSYGTPDTERFRIAQDCFMRSLVSYSLITYILQIRDRHNGNILLDTEGHIIHIDFGFMLSNSPGSVGFEQAPFKFPMEYVDILGGREGSKFSEFRDLLVGAFLSLRKHADNVCMLVEIMLKHSPLPCLSGGAATVAALRDRFHLALSEQQIEELMDNMLVSSCDNITTRMYDAFQYYSNGIL